VIWAQGEKVMMGVAIAVWAHPENADRALQLLAARPRSTIRSLATAAVQMGMELHIRLSPRHETRTGALMP
jgi:hypothetical protein